MNPLTVTWAPHLYTDIGWRNFRSMIHTGDLSNILGTPSGKTHRKLTKLSPLRLSFNSTFKFNFNFTFFIPLLLPLFLFHLHY